jgi:polyhydroxyalkanoate synthesis regulator phasin
MKRRWWIAGLAATLVVVAGAGAVMAQTPTPGAGGGTTFLDRVAQKLGIETPKLREAINSAANDEVDQAVKDGKITQQQADAIKQRIAEGKAPGFGDFPFGNDGHGPEHGRGFGMGFPPGADPASLANFLGMTPQQLMSELQADGATLASVAQAHGKSRDELKAFITQSARSHFDQAVKDGKLTQQQEDTMLSQLSQNVDNIVDHGFGHGHGHERGPKMMPMMPGSPAPDGGTGSGTPGGGSAPTTSTIFRG